MISVSTARPFGRAAIADQRVPPLDGPCIPFYWCEVLEWVVINLWRRSGPNRPASVDMDGSLKGSGPPVPVDWAAAKSAGVFLGHRLWDFAKLRT